MRTKFRENHSNYIQDPEYMDIQEWPVEGYLILPYNYRNSLNIILTNNLLILQFNLFTLFIIIIKVIVQSASGVKFCQ